MTTPKQPSNDELDIYEQIIAYTLDERARSYTGKVVVRGEDQPWIQIRQALIRNYLWPSRFNRQPVTTALDDWIVFIQDIKTHSGKHRHQGGLVIYILEGEGHSVVDGERVDWETGDLLLLPLRPGGVEHQHFNKYTDKPAKWIAFISAALYDWGASEMVQIENHPQYQERIRNEETSR